MSPERDRKPGHTLESASYSARQTEVAWIYRHPADMVWEAVDRAAQFQGLEVAGADRASGMLISKPAFSFLNMGRRVVFSLSKIDEGTRVRATFLHGVMSLQSRTARMTMLDGVLRTALRLLEREEDAREEGRKAQQKSNEAPAQSASAPAAAKSEPPASSPEATPAQHEEQAPPTQGKAPKPTAQRPAGAKPPGPELGDMDFSKVDWDEVPLEPPTGADAQRFMRRSAPRRSGLGIRRSLLWFLVGTALAVGLMYFLEATWK